MDGQFSELAAKAKWNKQKKQTSGFCTLPLGEKLAVVGVYVLKKEPHERKYDSFAYLLRNEFHVCQIDAQDILAGKLADLQVLVLPGGLCADFELSLGYQSHLHF